MRTSTRVLLAAYAVSQANILRILAPVRRGALWLQWTLDEERVRAVVDGWTPSQRERYRSHLAPDTLHPFLYGAALIALERDLRGRRAPGAGAAYAAAASAVALCDLFENVHHDRHVRGRITAASARRSGLASRAKWAIAAGVLARLVQLGGRSR